MIRNMSTKSKVVLAVGMLGNFLLIAAGSLQAAQPQATELAAASLPGRTLTLLPDGTSLVLGGIDSDGHVRATAMVQNPATASASVVPASVIHARAGHTGTVLANGTVLILGGIGTDGRVVTTAEVFDPVAQAFNVLASGAPTPRAFHTATLLTDGRLLVAGGVSQNGQLLHSAELWDFRQKRQTEVIPWPEARRNHSATLMANGEVLFQDGKDEQGNSITTAALFDANSQSIAPVGDAHALLQKESGAAEVRASSPQDGATDVPTDVLISMRFSSAVRIASINARTVSLKGPDGLLEARIVAAEGGMLAFITPSVSLIPGTVYEVTLSGAADARDASTPSAQFTFTTAGTAPTDAEHSQPTADGLTHAVPSSFDNLPLLHAPPGVTALAGRVLRLDGKPLPHVTLKIGQRKADT